MVKSPNPQRKKSLLDFRKSNSEGSKQPMEIQFRFYGGKSNFMENIDKISEGNEPQSFTFDDSNPIEEVCHVDKLKPAEKSFRPTNGAL